MVVDNYRLGERGRRHIRVADRPIILRLLPVACTPPLRVAQVNCEGIVRLPLLEVRQQPRDHYSETSERGPRLGSRGSLSRLSLRAFAHSSQGPQARRDRRGLDSHRRDPTRAGEPGDPQVSVQPTTESLFIHSKCHTSSPTRCEYFADRNELRVTCAECKRLIVTFKLAPATKDKPLAD